MARFRFASRAWPRRRRRAGAAGIPVTPPPTVMKLRSLNGSRKAGAKRWSAWKTMLQPADKHGLDEIFSLFHAAHAGFGFAAGDD